MGKAKILVVEDEALTARDLQLQLIQMGYDVPCIALSGEDAIKKAGEINPDLLLMDIKLAGEMDGIEAAKQIRLIHMTPVIYLSAYMDQMVSERAKDTEPFGYLTKPFSTYDLRNSIEMALYKHGVEKKLHREKEFTDAAIDAQIDTFFVFDPMTKKAIRWNKQFCEITGYSDEEIAALKAPDSYYSLEDLEKAADVIKEIMDKGQAKVRLSLICKDGRKVSTEYSASVIRGEDNNIKYIISIGRDIAERIRFEEEIEAWSRELEKRVKKKTEELERSQAELIQSEKLSAMGEMAGGLAHELNSPLAGLLPLLERYKDISEEGTREHKEFSLMLRACEHMAKVVRDFSAFSRDAKGLSYGLNLNEVIEHTLSFSIGRFKQKSIEVVREYKDDLPKIKGVKTELQQVVLNIITNAFDTMAEAGKFIIRTGTSGDNVFMEFIDNGAGIEKDKLDKIFDPFYTTKRPGKGTGLGLSISYKIVEKHEGEILVESEIGKGTKFVIYLPAIDQIKHDS